jgi:hypothetical protein
MDTILIHTGIIVVLVFGLIALAFKHSSTFDALVASHAAVVDKLLAALIGSAGTSASVPAIVPAVPAQVKAVAPAAPGVNVLVPETAAAAAAPTVAKPAVLPGLNNGYGNGVAAGLRVGNHGVYTDGSGEQFYIDATTGLLVKGLPPAGYDPTKVSQYMNDQGSTFYGSVPAQPAVTP